MQPAFSPSSFFFLLHHRKSDVASLSVRLKHLIILTLKSKFHNIVHNELYNVAI